MFATSLVGHIAGATISSKISAVHAWHIQHNDAWHGHTLLQYVLKGAANAMTGKAIQTRRQPITVNMLHKLFDELDLTTHLDAAIYAVATIRFYAQLCMGEICAGKEAYTVFNRATSPSRKHLQPPHTPAGSRMLQLPWTKVKRTAGKEVAICQQQGNTDPINALDRHMRINDIVNPEMALASYISTAGTRKLLTLSKFIKRCNEIWQRRGRPRFTGHSFRIGRTTYYLLQGINPDVVCIMGRWSSDAFIRYWHQLNVVATVHMELLQNNAGNGICSAAS